MRERTNLSEAVGKQEILPIRNDRIYVIFKMRNGFEDVTILKD